MKAKFMNMLAENPGYYKAFSFTPSIIVAIEKYSWTIIVGFLMFYAEFMFERKTKPF